MFREFISIRNGLLIATAFMIGFVWHRAGLPPAGLGLVDGVEPRPAKFVVQVRDTAPGTHKDHKIITGIFNESRIPHFKIVMMGDSITAGAFSWSELLGRESVGNRGIGGDTTRDLAARTEGVIRLKPEVVFVMSGINDLRYGADTEQTIEAHKQLISRLEGNGIRLVIQSILYTDKRELNEKVTTVNRALRLITEEKKITFLDLNAALSADRMLKKSFTYDGLHLNGPAYRVWADQVEGYLKENPLSK